MAFTIAARCRHEIEPIKGSRFIVDLFPVSNESQAKAALKQIRTEFPDATHHCSAWRIASPSIERANDDGEPAGSAGRPMLSQLQGRELVDTAAVVTRWFGGTKLGVGGLVRAYSQAVGEAIDSSSLRAYAPIVEFELSHDYASIDLLDQIFAKHKAKVLDSNFAVDVTRSLSVTEAKLDDLIADIAEVTAGGAKIHTPNSQ